MHASVAGGASAAIRALVCMAGAAALAYGQAASPARETRSQFVNLNVVALGSRNQPVTDLMANDFQVTDAGQTQRIVFFRHNDTSARAGAPLGPGELTNRPEGLPRHATAILFDFLNDSLGASSAALDQLTRALERLKSGDGLYLYFLTKDGKIFPVRPVPGGEGGLEIQGAGSWTKQSKQLIESAWKATFSLREEGTTIGDQVNHTFDALAAVGGQLAAIPGRKNIVWISNGVPMLVPLTGGPPADLRPYIRLLCAALDRANVAIYPVQQRSPGRDMFDEQTLGEFADLTGGRPEPKDVELAIQEALDDPRTSYQIAYAPAPGNWDGKHHELRVTCLRKGVRVLSKTAYYAFPETAADAQSAMEAVMRSPLDAAEIGLRVIATRPAGDQQTVHLSVRMDASDIALVREGDEYTGDLRVAFAGYLPNDRTRLGPRRIRISPVEPVHLRITTAGRDEALKAGIAYQGDFNIDAGMHQVRVVVMDDRLGVAGSVTVPVERLLKP